MIIRSASVSALFLAGAIGGLTACHSQTANAAAPENGKPTTVRPTREAPSSPTPAGRESYLYELVQKQPYRDTYKALIKEAQPPQDYLTEALAQKDSYQGLYSASEGIEAGGSTYRIALICPANVTCTEFGSAFLFTPDGRKAWAEIRDGDKPAAYLGNPDNAQRQALDERLERSDN